MKNRTHILKLDSVIEKKGKVDFWIEIRWFIYI